MSRDVTKIHHVTIKGESYAHIADEDKAISGYHTSSALSFANMFYEKRPMADLIQLAAHVITTAERFNSTGIEHLEIIRCSKVGIDRLTESRIADLKTWSGSEFERSKQSVYRQV